SISGSELAIGDDRIQRAQAHGAAVATFGFPSQIMSQPLKNQATAKLGLSTNARSMRSTPASTSRATRASVQAAVVLAAHHAEILGLSRLAADPPDPRHHGLLRVRRPRPRGCHAAKRDKKFSPSDAGCHVPLPPVQFLGGLRSRHVGRLAEQLAELAGNEQDASRRDALLAECMACWRAAQRLMRWPRPISRA